MKRKLNCILLVDDNIADNYYHNIIIKKMDIANTVEIAENGLLAIEFIKKQLHTPPEIIFLDLNMPKMNGWEFLEQYKHLDATQKAKVIILILTTSANPDDMKRAKEIEEVTGFETKPLTEDLLRDILNEHFEEYI